VVSGTIEVDEVHVAPRFGGRVAKIFAEEGQALKPGELIVEMDAAELSAQRDVTAAQLTSAERDADAQRAQELLKSHTVSPSDAERAASAAKTQAKTVEAARMRVEQARAQVAQMDAQLREMKVLAPADSVLEVLNVKVGDVLPPNREVATLILPQRLWVRVFVPEPWLGLIKVGDAVRIRVDSFRNTEFSGTVEQINRHAEFTPRNVQTVQDRIRQVFGVKVRLDNREDKLRAGMSADAFFPNVSR
jgi:HlyD family secretion protein